jgi:hypothetical protein
MKSLWEKLIVQTVYRKNPVKTGPSAYELARGARRSA